MALPLNCRAAPIRTPAAATCFAAKRYVRVGVARYLGALAQAAGLADPVFIIALCELLYLVALAAG